MNSRSTWVWLLIASTLFGFIYVYQRYLKTKPDPITRVLPQLQAAHVTVVQVRPGNEIGIKALRTNDTWLLAEPTVYPAQGNSVDALLLALERLTPATFITAREIRERPQAEADYGFLNPQASVVLTQTNQGAHLIIGARTAPGDQVFVQVVGREGAYVVDAELLNYIPRTANDWRDTTFVDLRGSAPDLITVTNAGRFFELQREAGRWQITRPSPARADNNLVEEALQRLATLRISQFVADDPKGDLEPFGLLKPELTIVLRRGTNLVNALSFGNSPTNNPREVFARQAFRPNIVTIPKHQTDPWRASVNELRDRHLLTSSKPVQAIAVNALDSFTVSLTNGQWRITPQNYPADAALVTNTLKTLASMQVVQFVKDVVTAPDLPAYGLAQPLREYVLHTDPPAGTNQTTLIAALLFGTNQQDRVFARRTDENSVYAVRIQDFNKLPARAMELRDRRLWNFQMDEVERVVIRQAGKTRHIVRNGPHNWALPPGSQGIINDLAVEETVKGLTQLTAWAWVALGDFDHEQFGLSDQSLQVTVELKNATNLTVRFGKESPSGFPYALVTLNGQPWVMEFPWALFRDVLSHLSIPANVP